MKEENWLQAFDGFGDIKFKNGIQLQPRSIASEKGTHAALVLSNAPPVKDFYVKMTYQNLQFLRNEKPNSWEVFWFMFNFKKTSNGKQTNYFIFKPNGIELGKAWGEFDQDFLFTQSSPLANLKKEYKLILFKKDQNLKVYIDDIEVLNFKASERKNLFDHSGQFGLYTEDAVVHIKDFALCTDL